MTKSPSEKIQVRRLRALELSPPPPELQHVVLQRGGGADLAEKQRVVPEPTHCLSLHPSIVLVLTVHSFPTSIPVRPGSSCKEFSSASMVTSLITATIIWCPNQQFPSGPLLPTSAPQPLRISPSAASPGGCLKQNPMLQPPGCVGTVAQNPSSLLWPLVPALSSVAPIPRPSIRLQLHGPVIERAPSRPFRPSGLLCPPHGSFLPSISG